MALQAWAYAGATTVPGFSRWAYTYGPLLLAVQGFWNETAGDGSGYIVLAGLNASAPDTWATRRPGGSLVFDIAPSGPGSGYTLVPYYEIQVGLLSSSSSSVPDLTQRWTHLFPGARGAL
jgi:hypothetical protein